jgi:hypothetical protein
MLILPYPSNAENSGARRSWRKESSVATSTVFKSFSGGGSMGGTGSSNKPVTRGNMISFRGGCGGETSNIQSNLLPPYGEVTREYSTSSTQVSQCSSSVDTKRTAQQVEEVDQNSVLKVSSSRGGVRFSNFAISDFCPGEIPLRPIEERDTGTDSGSCSHHRIADDGAFIFSTH